MITASHKFLLLYSQPHSSLTSFEKQNFHFGEESLSFANRLLLWLLSVFCKRKFSFLSYNSRTGHSSKCNCKMFPKSYSNRWLRSMCRYRSPTESCDTNEQPDSDFAPQYCPKVFREDPFNSIMRRHTYNWKQIHHWLVFPIGSKSRNILFLNTYLKDFFLIQRSMELASLHTMGTSVCCSWASVQYN